MTLDTHNPCRTCGACCNAFRVSFHWSEASPLSPYQVPEDLIEQVSPHVACMRGTHARQPGCAAHVGAVGVYSGCIIYENRPSLARSRIMRIALAQVLRQNAPALGEPFGTGGF